MGIEGYLVRVDGEAVDEIRAQAKEGRWERLEAVLDGPPDWLDTDILDEAGQDEDDEADDEPEELAFPTAFYEWVPPNEEEMALGPVPARFSGAGAWKVQEGFSSRVAIYSFVQLFPPPGGRGLTLPEANQALCASRVRDKSLGVGLLSDDTPKRLIEKAKSLQLLESVTSEGQEAHTQTQQCLTLIRAVTTHNDTSFFWNEPPPPPEAPPIPVKKPKSTHTPPSAGLVDLPEGALVRVLLRLGCGDLCRLEVLCKGMRGRLLKSLSAVALDAGDGALTPLGRLAWFANHRRDWGDCRPTKSLVSKGYRWDVIRRYTRRQKIDDALKSVRGFSLGGEWHMLGYLLDKGDVPLVCQGDCTERHLEYEKGGSGIKVMVHSPEQVASAMEGIQKLNKMGFLCECGDLESGQGWSGLVDDEARCGYHRAIDTQSPYELVEECEGAGVLCPRYADDIDFSFRMYSIQTFVEATCKNGQGLVCYVW